jgi:DHA3 family macrolide efflux protein-like MFS transporter
LDRFFFYQEALMKDNQPFFLIWAGQVVSILGSSLSWFALGVWIYQKTGSASQFALVALCSALPQMLVSPFAGVLVDRYNRRLVMAFADGGAAFCTLALVGLFLSGHIQIWHIYLLTACSAACNAVQAPAYSALVASTMKREQLGRVNGLLQFGQGLAEILAPTIAGMLVLTIRVPGVLAIDLATFCFAVFTLFIARFNGQDAAPHAPISAEAAPSHWLVNLKVGWQSLRAQPGLVNLLRYQTLFSFLWSLFGVLVVPMILGFSNPKGLGLVLTLAGAGLLTGSLVLSAWGGPKRRLTGVLVFELVSALAFCLMGSRPLLLLVVAAAFMAHFTLAFVSGLNEAIWQSQVEKAVQGRVFALKQAAVKAATLLAYLVAGGLADRVLEPLLRPGGAWSSSLGTWFGVGPGRGLAALFFLIGLVKAAAVLAVYHSPATRRLDESLVSKPISFSRH